MPSGRADYHRRVAIMRADVRDRLNKLEALREPAGGVVVVYPDHVMANGKRYDDLAAVPQGGYLVISGPEADPAAWSAKAVAYFEAQRAAGM
jgi:hypothetical protein